MSIRDGIDVAGDRLRTTFTGMAPRERVLVGFTALVLFAFVAYFAVGAMNKAKKKQERLIAATELAQGQVDALMAEYVQLAGTAELLDSRLEASRNFAPLTWLESVGTEMVISEKIRSMNERGNEETDYYTAQKIDLRIEDLTLAQVTDLIYRLETAPQSIRIDECRVKTDRKNRDELDVNMEIAVLKPVEGV